jgi:hypothetical protein
MASGSAPDTLPYGRVSARMSYLNWKGRLHNGPALFYLPRLVKLMLNGRGFAGGEHFFEGGGQDADAELAGGARL